MIFITFVLVSLSGILPDFIVYAWWIFVLIAINFFAFVKEMRQWMKDRISNFNSATYFIFEDFKGNEIEWVFEDDLTYKYSKGDNLSLTFEVVEDYSDDMYTFETLDYIKESIELSKTGQYASIKDYIN